MVKIEGIKLKHVTICFHILKYILIRYVTTYLTLSSYVGIDLRKMEDIS